MRIRLHSLIVICSLVFVAASPTRAQVSPIDDYWGDPFGSHCDTNIYNPFGVYVEPGTLSTVRCLELEFDYPFLPYTPPAPAPIQPNPPTQPPPDEPAQDRARGIGGKEKGSGCEIMCGNPINTSSFNKYQQEVDFVGPGTLPLSIIRHHNSLYADSSVNKGDFGQGWTSNFGTRLAAVEFPDPQIPGSNYEVVVENESGYRFEISSDDNTEWLTTENIPVNFRWDPNDEVFLWVDGTLTKLFMKSGDLISITHVNGEYLEYGYADGISPSRLDTVTHSSGATLSISYDASNRISTITDPDQDVYSYFYTASGGLDRVERPDVGASTSTVRYHYEHNGENNALTGVSYDWDGVTKRHSTYSYTGDGKGTATGLGSGIFWTHDVQEVTHPTLIKRDVTNTDGKKYTHVYEMIANMPRVTYIHGHADATTADTGEYFTYDANGYYDKHTDPEGNVIDYNYNGRGQLESMTTAYGTGESRTVTYEWDDLTDQMTRVTTPLLDTVITLDPSGVPELITQTNTAAHGIANQQRQWTITTLRYANDVIQSQTIDGPRSGVHDETKYEYNTSGLLTAIKRYKDASNFLQTTFSNYDAYGRVGRVTYPSGLIREFDYHPRGWILESREIVGTDTRTVTYEYFDTGDVKKVTVSGGSEYTFEYDAQRWLTKITRDDGDTDFDDVEWKKLFYDLAGNMVAEQIWIKELAYAVDPNCVPKPWDPCDPDWIYVDEMIYDMEFDHDSLGRLTETKYDNPVRNTEYAYNLNGQLDQTKDGYDRATQIDYDVNNQPDQTTFRNGGISETTYDANGNVSGVKDALGQWTYYRRDGFGQAWEIESPATGTTYYEYDVAGNMTKKTDARGIALTYEYDALDRITKTKSGASTLETYIYDTNREGHLYQVLDTVGGHTFLRNEAGEITSKTSTLSGTALTTLYSYDSDGRLDTITYPSGLVATYVYDSFGDVDKITAQGAGLALSDVVKEVWQYPWGPVGGYVYGKGENRGHLRFEDYEPYRLYSGTHFDRTYGFDNNWNINDFGNRTMTYDNMDRLKTHNGPDGNFEYDYDLNGNRNWHKLNGTQTTYNYNTAKTRLNSLSGGTSESRSYDANGNTTQIGSRLFYHNVLNRFWYYIDGANSYKYFHNAFGERQIKLHVESATTTRYVYDGPNLIHERVGSTKRDYIYLNGEMVGLVKDGVLYYVHTDHLDRPEVVTNSAKTVVWDSENNAFGNNPGTDTIGGLNVGFPGQYYDIESGTYYNYFRTYDATTGRYLQSDPIGLGAGLNTYSYAGGNPTNQIDPLGLFVFGSGVGASNGNPLILNHGAGITGALCELRQKAFGRMQHSVDSASASQNAGVVDPFRWDRASRSIAAYGAASATESYIDAYIEFMGVAAPFGLFSRASALKYVPNSVHRGVGANATHKVRKPGMSGHDAATDIPSWARGEAPLLNENGRSFAKRMLDEKYGAGNYPTGPGSEFSKLKKFADRAFENPRGT